MAGQATTLAGATAQRVAFALDEILPPDLAGADPLIRPSDHADFQSNAALALAKKVGRPPREFAAELVARIEAEGAGGLVVDVSGPGFVNIRLSDRSVWARIAELSTDERLGVSPVRQGERTVVDYSGPNVAKEMHVGHLRTTIIGDALVRVLGFLGADVIRQNHLGDWGTQFGMLIEYMLESPAEPVDTAQDAIARVSRLDALYRRARQQFDADPSFADRSRRRVVALQAGDTRTNELWRELVDESQMAFQAIYSRLGVLLEATDSKGESSYNAVLDDVVREVREAGVAVESDGALCVFSEDVKGPDGKPAPLILRKRDGGYGYATTDLATIRYRLLELRAKRLLYVVDSRQAQHFRLIFEAARRMGWLTDSSDVEHVAFGSVLGPDGKPFKTRSGDTVRLVELLDAAVERARREIESRQDGLGEDEIASTAAVAGIGAIKYADLSTSRTKDYVFDLERMVSFSGDTGLYLQYAHARISSILSRTQGEASVAVDETLAMHEAERALALALDEFPTVLADVADRLEPHRLCGYLFDLARSFTHFYEACPVLKAESPSRSNRLALCRTTWRTLAVGLGLLGIGAPDRL